MSFAEFGNENIDRTIQELARSDNLTLVVGAGASVESGLPTWPRLVGHLLTRAAQQRELDNNDQQAFVEWTMGREDVTGAGEVARYLLGKEFRDALHAGLYAGVEELTPGETARALATLVIDRADKVDEVVTTNYDSLLEQALRREIAQREMVGLSIGRLVSSERAKSGMIGVRHVHGVLTEGNLQAGTLILSNRDYFAMQDPKAWQESFFRDRLATSTCLFIGASLTDPNLLRYIYRSDRGSGHFAVFVRQDDSSLYDQSGPKVIGLREESQLRKWRGVGIEPILFDHYAQSAQFVWEIVAASQPTRYVPLTKRLATWSNEVSSILPITAIAFKETQDRLQRLLANLLSGTKQLINGEGHRLRRGEKLGMSMWVYDPGTDTLVNWASADRIWRDASTLEPTGVHWSSQFIAARAFCAGSMVSQSTSEHQVPDGTM